MTYWYDPEPTKEVVARCDSCHTELRMNEQASEAFVRGVQCRCGGIMRLVDGQYAGQTDGDLGAWLKSLAEPEPEPVTVPEASKPRQRRKKVVNP